MNTWVNRWRFWHGVFFVAAALGAAGLSRWLDMPPLAVQLLLLAGPVAVLGIPHGALDFAVGRRLLQADWGRRWPVVFLPAYGAVVVGIIALWSVAPGISLAAFLLVSVWHFGSSDAALEARPGGLRSLEILARGAVVITFPAACYPDQVNMLFNFLAPPMTAARIVELCAVAAPAAGVLSAGCALFHLARLVLDEDWNGWVNALELAGLTALFILAPPLFAFGIYFCLLHSLRHLLQAAGQQQPACPRAALTWMVRQAAPMTLVTVALAVAAYGMLGGVDLSRKLTQVIFIGLAALTFPHMLLAAVSQRRQTDAGPVMANGFGATQRLWNTQGSAVPD